jgi:8-oxo-dGTP pyrophosphatase MutT (NUDIX family)
MAKLFNIGIKGLIENPDGKILLLKAPGWERAKIGAHWDIPGGRIEEEKSIIDVLAREIEEEIGITKIKNPELFSVVISNHEIPFEDKVLGLTLIIYRVQIPGNSKIKLSSEHVEYEWVEKAEAGKRLAHKYPPEFTQLLS